MVSTEAVNAVIPSRAATSSATKIDTLTALRWFAAFYVFMLHMQTRAPMVTTGPLANLIGQGAIGMTFFFMLSGFVLTHAYLGRKISYWTYLRGRIGRIYPAYALVVALSFIVLRVAAPPSTKAWNIALNVFSLQGWLPNFFGYGINSGTWSLTVEWCFYLLFPLLLPPVARLTGARLWLVAAVAWMLAAGIPLVGLVFTDHLSAVALYSFPLVRLPEFIVGMCAAVLLRSRPDLRVSPALLIALSVIILGAFLMWSTPQPYGPGRLDWIVVPCIGALIIGCAMRPNLPLLSSAPLVWLGEISYGFYLFQCIPFMVLMHRDDLGIHEDPVMASAACLAAALTLSAASYYVLERPLRALIAGPRK
jgi:peptidoglycan/LPS O-acetylase OafA/YrhL